MEEAEGSSPSSSTPVTRSRTTIVERTTTVLAPPERVFEALTSPAIAPLVDPSVRAWTPDAEPIGVGTTFSIRGRLGRLPFRGRSQVVAWDPPRRAVFRSLTPTWPFSITADHGVVGRADGGTDYTWTITFVEKSPVARPAVRVAARLFRRAQERQGVALRSYVEAHASRGTKT